MGICACVSRRTRAAVVGLVVVALVVVFASAQAASPRIAVAGPKRAAPLLGLGDSVAAGYGLGPADGNPDNVLAYPYLVARAAGLDGSDLAVSGACVTRHRPGLPFEPADETPAECDSTTSAVEQARDAVDRGAEPDVVTVTVGANDIRFSDCFAFIIGTTGTNECAGDTFDKHLGALQRNLTELLRYLHRRLPHAQLLVTGYYNVLPDTAADPTHPCVLSRLLAAKARGVRDTSYLLLVHRKQFDAYAATVTQPAYHRQAQVIVDRLDQGIRAATVLFATFVSLQRAFAGHDMCGAYPGSGYEPFVFAPRIRVEARLGFTVTLESATPTETCRLPCNGESEKESWGLFVGEFAANGAPHPNSAGQSAIADTVAARRRG